MKRLVVFLVSALVLNVPSYSFAIDHDKKLHFGVSSAIGFVGYGVTDDKVLSYTGCMAIGFGKEVYDIAHSEDGFSTEDLVADALGCVVGVESSAYLRGVEILPSFGSDYWGINFKIPLSY